MQKFAKKKRCVTIEYCKLKYIVKISLEAKKSKREDYPREQKAIFYCSWFQTFRGLVLNDEICKSV